MASIMVHPLPFASPTLSRPNDATDIQSEDPSLQRRKKSEIDDKPRGRRRSRTRNKAKEETNSNGTEPGDNGNLDDVHSSGADGPSRKRRRSRKGLDKKFECSHTGCEKSYSRAEHLYRHQLNHTPKQIYKCDFTDCPRTFVRQDLRNRHQERHTAKGSQLQRKDSMQNNVFQAIDGNKPLSLHGSASPESLRPMMSRPRTCQVQYPSPPENIASPFSPATAQSSTTFTGSVSSSTPTDYNTYQQTNAFSKRSNSDHSLPPGQGNLTGSATLDSTRSHRYSFNSADHKANDMFQRPSLQTSVGHYNSLPSAQPNAPYQGNPVTQSSLQSPYVSQQHVTPFALPPPGCSTIGSSSSLRDAESAYAIPSPHTALPLDYPSGDSGAGTNMVLLEQMNAPNTNTMPVFGAEGYNRSPYALPADFVAFLFAGQQFNDSSPATHPAIVGQQGYGSYPDTQNSYEPYFSNDPSLGGFLPHNPQHPMAVTSLLDTSLPETVLSDEKSQEIVDLVIERFNETDHAPVAKQKQALLEGDRNLDTHGMSRKMMQTYILSYWWNFHPQLPILHKPTFSPDKTPNLLLIAMMAIGASCLDKAHGYATTQSAAELSNFLAWHLRWELFNSSDFRPPSKLWIFQALLLLEIYEKMFSTRALHERSHIHHATAIALMRRGSSLIGRSPLDSPPSVRDEKQNMNGSRHSSTSRGLNTSDEWWTHWITSEATRRAAFAAFVIDSTHATMFGHSTVMVAHEMRLALPCDEALWSATNSAEVGRIEASLLANGVKPVSFLEGLKRTLNGQEVRTNAFGRTILMAGLLSVSWHLNQRDLQVNSLGVSQALGGRDKWRGSLTRAFDTWKADFDRSLSHGPDGMPGPYTYTNKQDESVVFENRTVLHHLAHMAVHVDIVDCQIFARAERLLGRTIGQQDLNSAQRRMRDVWAPTAKARDATYYALRFLCEVLLPENSATGSIGFNEGDAEVIYSAREDVLMNRSWVIYFAALIVWCYGFALEGPTNSPIPAIYPFEDQVLDMRAYLRRLRAVNSPEELKIIRGFNGCSGMLMVLRTTFEKTRWELLREAGSRLENCIQLINRPA